MCCRRKHYFPYAVHTATVCTKSAAWERIGVTTTPKPARVSMFVQKDMQRTEIIDKSGLACA